MENEKKEWMPATVPTSRIGYPGWEVVLIRWCNEVQSTEKKKRDMWVPHLTKCLPSNPMIDSQGTYTENEDVLIFQASTLHLQKKKKTEGRKICQVTEVPTAKIFLVCCSEVILNCNGSMIFQLFSFFSSFFCAQRINWCVCVFFLWYRPSWMSLTQERQLQEQTSVKNNKKKTKWNNKKKKNHMEHQDKVNLLLFSVFFFFLFLLPFIWYPIFHFFFLSFSMILYSINLSQYILSEEKKT